MPNREKLAIKKQEHEVELPYLTWLKEVRREIHEETKGLTPEERGLYWANVRAELALEDKPLLLGRLPVGGGTEQTD